MFSLNPEINRHPFTIEEDCILMAAIKEYGTNYQNFPTNLLPGRNMKQIRNRYNNVLKLVKTREHWTELHDRKLMGLVEKYGTKDWVKVADEMVSHSRTSCRQRYTTIQKFLDKHPKKTVADVPRRKKAFSTNVTTENWMETIIQANNFESINMASDDENNGEHTKASQPPETSKPMLRFASYYDFFKYSFNFEIGVTVAGSEALFENIQTACQLLQAPTLPLAIDLYDKSFSSYVTLQNHIDKAQLEPALLQSLLETGKNDFQYPVNLNTILGLRALVAMFNIEKTKKDQIQRSIKCEPNTSDGHDALELFKMRFKSIFKQTAEVAKLQRKFTSVSLRLCAYNERKRPISNVPATVTSTDFHNNETVVRIIENSDGANEQLAFDNFDINECDDDERPIKRKRVTILESTTIGLPELKNEPSALSQASTSNETSHNLYRYRVQTSNLVNAVHIQPFTSESETECPISDSQCSNTDFVIWTPTVTDDATGSTPAKQTKKNE